MTTLTSAFIYTNDNLGFKHLRLFWICFYICMIVVNLLIYQYLQELEDKDCTCSETFRKTFQYVIVVKVLFMFVELISLALDPNTLLYANTFNMIASCISMFIHFPLSLLFVWKTNNSNVECECARNWKEYLLYVCFF